MGTESGGRVRAALPWVGGAAWLAGAAGLWAAGRAYGWTPGELVLAAGLWVLVGGAAARESLRQLFGPVFAYEALRLGRKRLTFLLRGLYACGVAGMLALFYLTWIEDQRGYHAYQSGRVATAELARFAETFFLTFLLLQFVAVVVLTPAYVAPAVADEKERKTLEFLLATDLRDREIVFGKLAARVLTILTYVLAGLPVIAFLQLFGGIDPDLLLAGTAATVVTVLGLSAVSILNSVRLKRARDAIALTYLLVVVYALGTMMVGIAVRELGSLGYGRWLRADGTFFDISEYTDWLAAGNVLWLLTVQYGPGGITASVADALGRYAAFWGVVGGAAVLLATLRLRAVALRQAHGGDEPRRQRRARRRPDVGDDPVFWKEVFVEGNSRGGAIGWLVQAAIVVLTFGVPAMILVYHFGDLLPGGPELFGWAVQATPFPARWDDFVEGISVWVRMTTGVLSALLLLTAAVRGAGAVTGERDRDTWVSLVSTPLTAHEMLTGKFWGCVLGMRKLYAVLLLVWGIGLAVGAIRVVMLPAMLVAAAVFVAAFAWLGLFCSVSARTTLIATVRAILAAVFLGGGFWLVMIFCCVLPIEVMSRGSGPDSFLEELFVLLAGGTPPFVMGWLPLPGFERWDLGPFRTDSRTTLGPVAPVIGVGVWAGFALVLAAVSHEHFRELANRDRRVPRATEPRSG